MSEARSPKKIKTVKAIRKQYILESIHDHEMKLVEIPTSYKEYDKDKNVVLDISWDHAGNLSEKFEYRFEDNKVVEQKIFLDEEEVAEAYRFEYENDRISKAYVKYLDEHEEVCTYNYDKEGRVITKEFIDDDGEEGEKEEFVYENGKLVSYTKHGDFGLEEERTQIWDGDKLIEKDQHWVVEEEHVRTFNTYNNEGQLISRKEVKGNGHITILYAYNYDEKGRLIKVVQHEEGDQRIDNYRYDDKDNEIYMDEVNSSEKLNFKVDRVYDDEGNVLESHVEIYADEEILESKYSVLYDYTFFE